MNPRSHGRWWQNGLLFVCSLLFTCTALELAARRALPDPAPWRLRDRLYHTSLPPVIGHNRFLSNPPPAGAERLPRKPDPGEVRVFVFGESSVEGVPFAPGSSAVAMLHDLLAEELPGRPLTVVNMGRTGAVSSGIWYHLTAIRGFRPDVVVFYHGVNDGSFGMPGEHRWAAAWPRLHAGYRWLIGHSVLAWMARVHGPQLIPGVRSGPDDGGADGGGDGQERSDPFPFWSDLLVAEARGMGARVVVLSPVRYVAAVLEPGLRPDGAGRVDFARMDPAYRRLLTCRLDPPCDFDAALLARLAEPEVAEGAALADYRQQLDRLAEGWRSAAARHGGRFVDFRSLLAGVSPGNELTGRFFADEIHLNREGYLLLARAIGGGVQDELGAPASIAAVPPGAGEADRYRDGAGNPYSMGSNYLRRGWYLCAVPCLELGTGECADPAGCAASRTALSWLAAQVNDAGPSGPVAFPIQPGADWEGGG